jgi:hypothetical protein
MKRTLGYSILALALALPLGAAPTMAVEKAAEPGCGETLDLAAMLAGNAQICPAELPQNPAPELKVGRTCRCSCGFPCKKDSDCGPGGICSGGITCC